MSTQSAVGTQFFTPAKKPPRFSQIPTLQKLAVIVDRLLEKKGGDIVALDLSKEAGPTESTVIVTAATTRHCQGLADSLLEECRRENFEFLRMEGYTTGLWILLDLNDVIVHIFQPETRALYRLDDLWPSAPVVADCRQEAR